MWKQPGGILSKLRSVTRMASEGPITREHRLFERPTRDDVLQGFRFILGRELADEDAIRAHMRIPTVDALRTILLRSDEFREKYKGLNPEACDHPNVNKDRDTVVFIHLRKTGGISLRVMLERLFAKSRRCPVREDELHYLSVAEIGQYDFFSGHFSMSSVRFIPRNNIRTVLLFREPTARLISMYRFSKAHSVRDEFSRDTLVTLANELTAEEFFERPEVRNSAAINNNYFSVLRESNPEMILPGQPPCLESANQALDKAKCQIRALTALGITERFAQSVSVIHRALNFSPPPIVEFVNVTDQFPEGGSPLRRVEPVKMTPRLEAALEDLTVFDRELYQFAICEFEKRCADHGV